MLPMITILASTPWSYRALRYGSIRGYSAIMVGSGRVVWGKEPRYGGGGGRKDRRGEGERGGKEGAKEQPFLYSAVCDGEPLLPRAPIARLLGTAQALLSRRCSHTADRVLSCRCPLSSVKSAFSNIRSGSISRYRSLAATYSQARGACAHTFLIVLGQ